jgi:hypothetical protein
MRFISACPGRDEPECDRSDNLTIAACDEEHAAGSGKCIGAGEVIAFGRIQRLHKGVRLGDQPPDVRQPRVFGGDANFRLTHDHGHLLP